MSTGDTDVRCGGLTLLLQCFYYVFLLIHWVIFAHFPATHAWQLGYHSQDFQMCRMWSVSQNRSFRAHDLGRRHSVNTALITMNPFPVHSGGGTPAILTIAGSDSGGGAGIQVSRTTTKNNSGPQY